MSRIPKAQLPAALSNLSTKPPNSVTSTSRKETTRLRLPALRRRSKSVADLTTLDPKPLAKFGTTVANTKPKQRQGLKRVATPEATAVKQNKVKIPTWDYKARYQILLEEHSALQVSVDAFRTKAAAFEALTIEKDGIENELKQALSELQVISLNRDLLKTELVKIKQEEVNKSSRIELLEETVTELKALLVKLKDERNELENQINVERSTNAKLNLDNGQLKIDLRAANEHLVKLNNTLEEHKTVQRRMHNQIQDLKGNIRVFCRVRPAVTGDEQDRVLATIHFLTDNSLEICKSKENATSLNRKAGELKLEFTFDKVFPPEAQHAEIFEELSELVQSALNGYDVCVFAYGQTGSGKTYTMQGNEKDLGMIPRTVDLIFKSLKELEASNWTYTVSASFLEIYNENIHDLLEMNSNKICEVKYNEGRGVTVTNLQIRTISSASELKKLMATANNNRAVAATDFNKHSSRSHAVTKISLEGLNNCNNLKFRGSLNLVDLAGSESAKTSAGDRLVEIKNINKSLSTLGTVMLALHNKDNHVPYRNSKLTFLLQSCLGGNSKTLMIVNITPFEESYGESINSLRFAAKVKEVKTVSKRNQQ